MERQRPRKSRGAEAQRSRGEKFSSSVPLPCTPRPSHPSALAPRLPCFPLLTLALLATLFPAWTTAQSVDVIVRLDKSDCLIGDRITYELAVQAPAGVFVEFPTPEFPSGLVLVEIETPPLPSPGRGPQAQMRRYRLTAFQLGEYRIPEPEVIYRALDGTEGRARGKEAGIRVKPLAPEDAPLDKLRGLKGPVEIPSPVSTLMLVAVAIGVSVLGIILCLVLVFSRPGAVARARVREKPPDVVALRELGQLERIPLKTAADARELYQRVSACLRKYLEGRYQLDAPRMTSEEVLRNLQIRGIFSEAHRQWMARFLRLCDRITYGNAAPDLQALKRAMEDFRGFIEQMRPTASARKDA